MRQEERKYPVLSTMSIVLKVLAVIVLVVGIIGTIATPGITTGGIILGVLTAAFSGIVLYALADVILVVIDIEHNTFVTSQAIESRATPAPPQTMPQARPEGEERRVA